MSEDNELGVEFVQPAYAKYREPLYKRLVDNYDVRFHFLKDVSPGKAKSVPEWLPSEEYGDLPDLKKIINLISMIQSSNARIVVTSISTGPHTTLFALLSKLSLLDKRIVLWSEEWRSPVSNNPQKRGLQGFLLNRPAISKFVLRNVDSLLLPHEKWFDYWDKLGVNEKDVFYVSQCSKDYSNKPMQTLDKSLNLENKTVILYLGNIIERKGLDILIRSFQEIDDSHDDVLLLVVGDGPFRSKCENIAEQLQISQIEFTGRVPEENLGAYYQKSDIFVLPACLRAHYEACPIAVLEAMSVELPVIVTDAVGSADWLIRNGENGFVVKEGNVKDLNQSLQLLISDPGMRDRFGKKSRDIFEEFNSFDRMFSGFSRGIQHAAKKDDGSKGCR